MTKSCRADYNTSTGFGHPRRLTRIGPFWLCSLVVTVVLTSLTSNSFSNWTDCDYEDQMVPATSSSSQQCLEPSEATETYTDRTDLAEAAREPPYVLWGAGFAGPPPGLKSRADCRSASDGYACRWRRRSRCRVPARGAGRRARQHRSRAHRFRVRRCAPWSRSAIR